jgi:ankyrin repeat protein
LSKITFALVSAVFCLLLLTNTAYSQTPSPITYLFVEVKDTSGKAIDDATVTVDGSVATKTNKDGFAEARFLRSNQRRYDLQVSKAGYLTSEHVLFSYCVQSYSIRTRESFVNSAEDQKTCNPIPISVQLLRIPVTVAERQSIEAEERKRQFLLAAKRGDAASLRKLLEAGVTPDTADNQGVPAIAWAAFAGDADTIKTLLDRGAVVRNRNTLANQALLVYLTEGIRNHGSFDEVQAAVQPREEVVRKLVEADANLNVQGSFRGTVLNKAIQLGPYGAQTYLSSASYYLSIESIRLLITAGADVNGPDVRGLTPLMSAAEKMSVALIKMLLEAGARYSINAKDNEGRTALMLAAERGHVETIKTLLEAGAAINAKDNMGKTALMYTQGYMYSSSSSLDAGKCLIAAGASINDVNAKRQTPLMLAAQRNYLEEVKILLEAGARASVNARDDQGKTALMYVKRQQYNDASADIIRSLVAAGADVNAIDDDGETPLMLSLSKDFYYGNPIALINEGARASINKKDKHGRTALMFAAQSGDVRMIQMLLDVGASLNARDNKGQTALTYAALGYSSRSDVIRFLVSAGLKVDDENDDGQTALMLAAQRYAAEAVSQLLKAGADSSVNKKDKVGRTALMYAVSEAIYPYLLPEAVTSLIGAGADVNEADESGQTVLMFALRGRSLQSIKRLLEGGARVNAQDKQGLTALMHAIECSVCGSENEMAEEVRVLLEGGADVRIKDNQGRTALMLAKQAGLQSLISLLEEAERRQ